MPLEKNSRPYWDSVFNYYDSIERDYQRWEDSMEALNGETVYELQKELFAGEAQFYLVPVLATILIIILVFGVILLWDSRQAQKAKTNKKNSILNYRESETKSKKVKKVR